MKRVALCGAADVGKDTVADMLPARKLAFADALYREVAAAYGVQESMLRERVTKETPLSCLRLLVCESEQFLDYLRIKGDLSEYGDIQRARSPRQILQWWGDYRRAQDPEYFVTALINELVPMLEAWVITDVRFPNEAKMLRELGGELWQIQRPGRQAGVTGHRSDTAGDEFQPEHVVRNDGSLAALRRSVLDLWARG